MSSRLFSTLIPQVVAHATGCPPPQIITALKQSATELCRGGYIWTEAITPLNVVALTSEYTPTVTNADGRIHTVLWAAHDQATLGPRIWATLMATYPTYPDTAAAATPTLFSQRNSQVLNLYPVPVASLTGGLTAQVVLVPTTAATGIEDRVMTDFEEEIVRGALHRVLALPDKSWSNPKVSDFYGRKFRNDIAQAKARYNKGMQAQSLMATAPRIV